MGFLLAGQAQTWRKAMLAGAALVALAGCQDMMEGGGLFGANADSAEAADDSSLQRRIGRDVEAPEVFQIADKGLWDGRPSLGGVWVAHPDVTEPERVIIRNTTNSKFVIGALFRRERTNPGPAFQVSSDAADALGMLAGAPAPLNVTALRREEAAKAQPQESVGAVEPGAIETSNLAAAENAEAEGGTTAEALRPPAAASQPQQGAAVASTLSRPYIQIGIFSVQQNAQDTATAMRHAGMTTSVHKEDSRGKTFWRVVVGPAATESERAALLEKIKGAGFDDAYAVRD